MKQLIPYTVVASFMLMASGLYFGWITSLIGLGSLLLSYAAGVYVLGSDDRDFQGLMARLELQAASNETRLKQLVTLSDQAAAKASEALAELRREQSGRWPDRS